MKVRPIFNAHQCQELDRLTKESFSLSDEVLMELAGSKIADVLSTYDFKRYLFLCGPGNNSGDALVIIRHLFLLKPDLHFSIYLSNPQSTNTLFEVNLDRVIQLSSDSIQIKSVLPDDLNAFDCIVDGLFGTGLNKTLSNELQAVIESVNQANTFRVAIDIPSGLHATSGELLPNSFKAALTLSIGANKLGFYFGKGSDYCGTTKPIEIGFRYDLVRSSVFELQEADSSQTELARKHKYDDGFVQIIAGSANLSGAAYLAAKAALASGAAAVQLLYPKGLFPVFDCLLPDVLKKPIGSEDNLFFKENDFDELIEEIESKKGTVLIGPGLGSQNETIQLVKRLLSRIKKPLIIDADGLKAIMADSIFSSSTVILTPHIGELSRIIEKPITSDLMRLEETVSLAQKLGVDIFSKGDYGFFTEKNGITHILPYRNDHFRKTGYGDVFSGWLASSLLTFKHSLSAFNQTSFNLYRRAIVFQPNDLRPEHLIQ